jgi:hypothetical protein
MPRPRKTVEPVEAVPPGPVSLVIRAGAPGYEKIVCGQLVYGYEIDQSDPSLIVVYGHLRPAPEPVVPEPVVVPDPVVEA